MATSADNEEPRFPAGRSTPASAGQAPSVRKNRLEEMLQRIQALLLYTSQLGTEGGLERILEQFVAVLRDDMRVERIILYFRHADSEEWQMLLNRPVGEEPPPLAPSRDLAPFVHSTVVRSTDNPALQSIDAVLPVLIRGRIGAYLLVAERDEARIGISPVVRNLSFIQTLAVVTCIAIDNHQRHEQALRQRQIESDLEFAAKIQRYLIPAKRKLNGFPNTTIASWYEPYFAIGGDYFDVFYLGGTRLGLCVGDISGKGVSSALAMTNFQAFFRATFTESIPLEQLAHELNAHLWDLMQGEKYITFFMARYDSASGVLEFLNAGHNVPLLYDWDCNTLTELPVGGVGFGMVEMPPPYRVGRLSLCGEQTLIMYTDGVVERSANGEISVREGLLERAIVANRDPNRVLDIIKKEVEDDRTTHRSTPFDDISVVVIHLNGKEEGESNG